MVPPLIQFSAPFWLTHKRPAWRLKEGRRGKYYYCNVPGCDPDKRRRLAWPGLETHLQRHGKPAPRKGRARKGKRWTCPYCAPYRATPYECAINYKYRHLWDESNQRRCRYAPPPDNRSHRQEGEDTDEEPESNSDEESDKEVQEDEVSAEESGDEETREHEVSTGISSDEQDDADDAGYEGTGSNSGNTDDETDFVLSGGTDQDPNTGAPTNNEVEQLDQLDGSLAEVLRQRDDYFEQMVIAHRYALEKLEVIAEKLNQEHNEPANSPRLSNEIGPLIQTLKKSLVTPPLLWNEYREGIKENKITDDSDIFLFLSAAQAREFLQNGRPRVTILVPASLDPIARPTMDLDSTLRKLAASSTVNYHDLLQKPTEGLYAATNDAATVIDQMQHGANQAVINLLDMGLALPCSVASFIQNQPGWDLLDYSLQRSDTQSAVVRKDMDFSLSSSFQLCAMLWSWSTTHIDRGGVATYTKVEQGDKLWLNWAARSYEALKYFGWAGEPQGNPFLIYLRTGDQLLQPAGTPHAVLTGPYEPISFMTGKMYAPSQNLDRQAECLRAEAWSDSSISNEDTATQMRSWMNRVATLMRQDSRAFPWPDKVQQAEFEDSLKAWEQKVPRCNCTKGCVKARCVCIRRNKHCSPLCHFKEWPDHKELQCQDCRPFSMPYNRPEQQDDDNDQAHVSDGKRKNDSDLLRPHQAVQKPYDWDASVRDNELDWNRFHPSE